MSKRSESRARRTVQDFERAMETIAPTALAQQWDNVGLLLGRSAALLRRALFAIDLTRPVADEAIRFKADLLFCYHPPIFQPIKKLTDGAGTMDSIVLDCARHDIALYASHTALDAAKGGTNDVIAALCGIETTEPLEYVDTPKEQSVKLVVFVPLGHVETVANAAFRAGAGIIGDYSHCSYRSEGTGTFFGGTKTNPALGRKGRLETVEEIRLETIVSQSKVAAVVTAVREAHPYEEPAFDIYPLSPTPVRGIGRVGNLPKSISLGRLAQKLAKETHSATCAVIGRPGAKVRRAIILVGAAGTLPLQADVGIGDVIITGEIRHHDALTIDRMGAGAIALGHWTSERPVLSPLVGRLRKMLKGVQLKVSRADREPFAPLR